jgi:energy-coupling factor transporter ATP-binding protein EcfA2
VSVELLKSDDLRGYHHYHSNALRWNGSEDAPASSFCLCFIDGCAFTMKTLERQLRHSNAERWNDETYDTNGYNEMKITKLHAENVHGYLPIDVSFFDDLTFLTGLNGSGKTSALRLLMALLTPNISELASINFSLAEVTVLDNTQETVVSAKKTKEGIELRVSSIDEPLIINRPELELFVEAKRSDEPSLKLREMYKSNLVFASLSNMSTPMFLGLDRRFFVLGSMIDDFDDFRRHEYMARRYWPEELNSRNLSDVPRNLLEVNYLVVNCVQEIRAEQEELDENLRKEFFKKAFEYKPSDFLASNMQAPSKHELDNLSST